MNDDDIQLSASGFPTLQRKLRPRESTTSQRSAVHGKSIERHLERYLGKADMVFHEIHSDPIHLDVLHVPATRDRPYQVLMTSGVSDLPMHVPEGLEDFSRAEIMMAIPADWPVTQEAFQYEANYWPVRMLKTVGKLPHEHDTWLGWAHTIPNGSPPQPVADTNFIGCMLTYPYWMSTDFFGLRTDEGVVISFYTVVPLYQEEMDLKLKKGPEVLEERFEKQGISLVLNTQRPNLAKKRWWFW